MLNKIDLVPDPEFSVDDPRVIAVLRVSCATGEGIDELRRRLFTLVPEPVAEDRPDELADFLVYKPEPKARPWRLLRTDGGYRVLGTPPSEEELERALKAAGARKGATSRWGTRSWSSRDDRVCTAARSTRRTVVMCSSRARAKELLGLSRLIVLVAARPGHKAVETPAELRARDGARGVPGRRRRRSTTTHARSIFCAITPSGRTPGSCSARTSSPTSCRGRSRTRCSRACGSRWARGRASRSTACRVSSTALEQPERVRLFEMEPVSGRVARPPAMRFVEADVPPAVAEIIRREGLYRTAPRVH